MKIKRESLYVLFIIIGITLLSGGCGAAQGGDLAETDRPSGEGNGYRTQGTGEAPLVLFTTIYPLYDFASKIGGERVNVQQVIPPGGDAHDFEPTPGDLIRLHGADLFIYNGLGLDMWAEDLLAAVEGSQLKGVNSSENIEPLSFDGDHHHGEGHEGHAGEGGTADPHVWLDPLRAKVQGEAIMKALVERDPEHAPIYEGNFKELAADLEALHERFKGMSERALRKEFVVSHQAYAYLADRYGLKQKAIAGLSFSQEPGPKKMEEMIRFIREEKIPYILVESNAPRRIAQAIQSETGAEVLVIYNLENVSEEVISQGHDYFSLMEHNLKVLEKALGQKR